MAASTTTTLIHTLEHLARSAPAISRASSTAAHSLASTSRSLATLSSAASSSFKLPDLPYDFGALEPALSGEIMRLHHGKHHAAYVTNLNASLEKYRAAELAGDVAGMIALQQAIRFNGGGHVNHAIFWQNLAPRSAGGGVEPAAGSELGAAVAARFGSTAALKAAMSAAGAGVQGSGWAWLGLNKAAGNRLEVTALPNQDPLSTTGLVPREFSSARGGSPGLRVRERAAASLCLQLRPLTASVSARTLVRACACVCARACHPPPRPGQLRPQCSESTSGSTPTTCSTRTCARTTSRPSGALAAQAPPAAPRRAHRIAARCRLSSALTNFCAALPPIAGML
jgi:Fe-Mn family superoxide dismutase